MTHFWLDLTAKLPPEPPKLPAAWLPEVKAAVAAYQATWAAGAQPQGSAQPPDDALLQVLLTSFAHTPVEERRNRWQQLSYRAGVHQGSAFRCRRR